MIRAFTLSLIVILVLAGSCSIQNSSRQNKDLTIEIQPFEGFPRELTEQITKQLKAIFNNVVVNKEIPLFPTSFYEPRRRYRADTIINIFKRSALPNHVIIGLTNYDISASEKNIKDWGIMGLGFRPGNACVVSTFRLSRKTLESQFYKVCIHELGHTAGLNHCPIKTCFMRDAEGGNPTDEEVDFCNSCKGYLKKNGWIL